MPSHWQHVCVDRLDTMHDLYLPTVLLMVWKDKHDFPEFYYQFLVTCHFAKFMIVTPNELMLYILMQ